MALYSLFQEAFTAPTSARDVGQEMLHATLLLSCAFVGWCASTALINFIASFQKDPNEGKAKEGSNIFREEVAAYVQANTIKGATKHFGLSRAEIRNCIDAGQKEGAMWKVGQIWQFLQDAMPQRETPLPPSPLLQPSKPPLPPRTKSSKAASPKKSKKTKSLKNHEDEAEDIQADSEQADSEQVEMDSEPECEDACTLPFSIAPSLNPGLMLLEQYGVFGAPGGMWSGAVVATPIPRHLLPDIDYSIMEEDEVSEEEEPEDGEDECPQEDHTDSVVEEEPEAEQLELEESDEAELEEASQIEAIEDLEVDELDNQMLSEKVEDTTKDDSSFEPSTRSEATDETDLEQDDSYVGQEDYSNQASTRGYDDGAMAMEDHSHTQQGWNHNTAHHVQSQPVQVGAAGYHHSCGVIFDANLLQQIHEAEGAVQEEGPQDAGAYYADNFACSHGYAVSSYEHYTSGEQYSYDMNARVWVPLEYSW